MIERYSANSVPIEVIINEFRDSLGKIRGELSKNDKKRNKEKAVPERAIENLHLVDSVLSEHDQLISAYFIRRPLRKLYIASGNKSLIYVDSEGLWLSTNFNKLYGTLYPNSYRVKPFKWFGGRFVLDQNILSLLWNNAHERPVIKDFADQSKEKILKRLSNQFNARDYTVR